MTILDASDGTIEYTNIDTYYDKRDKFDVLTVLYLTERVDALLKLTGERCQMKIVVIQGTI
jgi:hypothetical protein